MEIIRNIYKQDINTSLMHFKRRADDEYYAYQKAINDETLSLEKKMQLVKAFAEKIDLYNRVLTTLTGLIVKYCDENNITVYRAAIAAWESTYNTSWGCTSNNGTDKFVHITESKTDDGMTENTWEVDSCSFTPVCNICNNVQSSCDKKYYTATTCGDID